MALTTYVYSAPQIAGTVGPANHLVLVNPVGSGKIVTLGGVFISHVTEGAVSGPAPIRGWFVTGVSGGTLVPVSDVGKSVSFGAAPSAQVRLDNPTVTLGASWFNSPAIRGTGASSASVVHQIPAAVPGGIPITFLPGEGTAIRTEVGDLDQRWNISIAWTERRSG